MLLFIDQDAFFHPSKRNIWIDLADSYRTRYAHDFTQRHFIETTYNPDKISDISVQSKQRQKKKSFTRVR